MNLSDKLKKAIQEAPKREWKLRPEILLCPNIPQPMHGVAPREILGRQWWDDTRKEAYKSTNYHCIACGVHKTLAKLRQWLEGHELYEINYRKGRMTYLETVPLCHCCHSYIHDGRLQMLLEAGKIHHSKFVTIIQHGDAVLYGAGLKKLTANERVELERNRQLSGKNPEWGDWRLVLNGKLYPPKHRDIHHLTAAMEDSNRRTEK